MKRPVVVCLVVCCFCISFISCKDDEFRKFRTKFSKRYESAEEFQLRKQNFEQNQIKVQLHNNSTNTTFQMKINSFADLSEAEWKQYLSSHNKFNSQDTLPYSEISGKLPPNWDWRKKGVVPPVQNQGQCGSTALIVAVEVVESACAIQQGMYQTLSTQQIIDCGPFESGCNGGPFNEIENYIQTAGLETDSEYPYTGEKGTCNYDPSEVVCKISQWNEIPSGNETAMQAVIALLEPVAVMVDGSQTSFQLYSSGVYSDPNCSESQLDTMLLNIGYGTLNGEDFWICQNSWGASWGMGGIILIARNKDNMCGIATSATYPIVANSK